jgi:hypothetical protein
MIARPTAIGFHVGQVHRHAGPVAECRPVCRRRARCLWQERRQDHRGRDEGSPDGLRREDAFRGHGEGGKGLLCRQEPKVRAFLAENGKKAGVTTTASGLQYEVLKQGTGAKPAATDTVKVHYEGKLLDGTVFDSSVQRGEPVSFPLNRVIPGWTEGVQLMTVGSKYKFVIPSELAYGDQGAGPIPPHSVLQFEVELLSIEK